MKTPRVDEPQQPENRRTKRPRGDRPKRGEGSATTGFGNVMRDVRGTGSKGGAAAGAVLPGMPGFDPALAEAARLDPGAQAVRAMGGVATAVQLVNDASYGVRDAVEAQRDADRGALVHGSSPSAASAQAHAPTPIVRMTPSALLETVLDEATKLELERASKELHVELEPADLGPVVVRLRKGPDGALDIGFRTREGDAARVLEQGTDSLRGRLAEAGFASVAITVQHDAELRLAR